MKSRRHAVIGEKLINHESRGRIGSAIWLFAYLSVNRDYQTGILKRKVEVLAEYFKTNRKTIQRWMKDLELEGCIETRRLGQGYLIKIQDDFLCGQKSPNSNESWDKSRREMRQIAPGDGTSVSNSGNNFKTSNTGKVKGNEPPRDTNVPSTHNLCSDSLFTPPNPPKGEPIFLRPEWIKPENIWEVAKEHIKNQPEMLAENFTTWFTQTVGIDLRPGRVLIKVPNRFNKKCLEENYSDQINQALVEACGFVAPPAPEFQVKSA